MEKQNITNKLKEKRKHMLGYIKKYNQKAEMREVNIK